MSNLTRPSEFLGPDCWTHWPSFMDEAVVAEPGRALGRQLLVADPFGHGPGRLGDQADDRRLQLRRRLVGLAFDDVAVIDVLPVAPIIEERGGGVDVDPGRRRVARQPAQPLHRDRELARAIAGTGVERIERVAADDPVRLEAEFALQLLHRRDEVAANNVLDCWAARLRCAAPGFWPAAEAAR